MTELLGTSYFFTQENRKGLSVIFSKEERGKKRSLWNRSQGKSGASIFLSFFPPSLAARFHNQHQSNMD